jgi:NADH-quinone oxidoreductase subunit C
MSLSAAATKIQERFTIESVTEFRGETTLRVAREEIANIAHVAKDELGFDMLLDITGIDNFGDEPRFEVVYELYSLDRDEHLRLKLSVSEDDLTVPTITTVWATADWHEREIFDMMGIKFAGHPDLRRILMWDGYPYFPLRKDFPLAGKTSDVPEVAFTKPAPLEGGPFVTIPTTATTKDREPRARTVNPIPEQESNPSGDRIK